MRFLSLDQRTKFSEEIHIYAVCRIEPQSVDIELIDPHAHGIKQMLHHSGIAQIQLDKLLMSLPTVIVEAVSAGIAVVKVQSREPVLVWGIPKLLLHILECPETSADMIEHAVQHDVDMIFPKLRKHLLELILRAQPGIGIKIIRCVIAMRQ